MCKLQSHYSRFPVASTGFEKLLILDCGAVLEPYFNCAAYLIVVVSNDIVVIV